MVNKKIHSILEHEYTRGVKKSFLITLCGHRMNSFNYFVRYNQQKTSRKKHCENCANILFKELNRTNLSIYYRKGT